MAKKKSDKPEKVEKKAEVLELISPPFISDHDNVVTIHTKVGKLYEFLEHYRKDSNGYHERDCKKQECLIGNPKKPPALELHLQMPFDRIANLVVRMRKLRHAWDTVLRNYEERWDCEHSRRARHVMLFHAFAILDSSYLTDEVLEMRRQQQAEEENKMHIAIAGPMGAFLQGLGEQMQSNAENNPHEEEDEDDD
jgi:hypothetical protein